MLREAARHHQPTEKKPMEKKLIFASLGFMPQEDQENRLKKIKDYLIQEGIITSDEYKDNQTIILKIPDKNGKTKIKYKDLIDNAIQEDNISKLKFVETLLNKEMTGIIMAVVDEGLKSQVITDLTINSPTSNAANLKSMLSPFTGSPAIKSGYEEIIIWEEDGEIYAITSLPSKGYKNTIHYRYFETILINNPDSDHYKEFGSAINKDDFFRMLKKAKNREVQLALFIEHTRPFAQFMPQFLFKQDTTQGR
jgi:hypothetical protein